MAFNGFHPKKEMIPYRREEDAFRVRLRPRLVVEFPFRCPNCHQMVESKDEIKGIKSIGGNILVEHIRMGCVLMVKELPQMTDPQQTMLGDTEAKE